jgi:valyl-tRNA synthetase
VREGRLRIVPRQWTKTYDHWMENIRPWCVSRQLWWGHRIPAWYCDADGSMHVAREAPAACGKCGGPLRQDTDVLDTWFSSGLWPFSTLGWPDETEDLKAFYPTAVVVTSFDILFFWIARMAMLGLRFMGEVPFRDVYIHPLVRDAEGQKMSKSRGNVIDPLILMEQYGTDAFRFTLVALAAQGRDIRLAEDRVESSRNFANKLWNAARLVLGTLEGYDAARAATLTPGLPEQWIASRLDATVAAVRDGLRRYRFNDAASAIYHFLWHEYCDWYLEIAKVALYRAGDPDGRLRAQHVLVTVLEATLRLLHPFMPFITEDLWQRLPRGRRAPASIMVAAYPRASKRRRNPDAERRMTTVMDTVTAVRTIRGEMRIPPSQALTVRIRPTAEHAADLAETVPLVEALTRARVVVDPAAVRPPQSALAVVGATEIFVDLTGVVDLAAERARLQKEVGRVDESIRFLTSKLERPEFVERAPAAVVDKERERLEEQRAIRAKLEASLAWIAEGTR